MPAEKTSIHVSAFPSEILPEFLYLGSYDNASRSELLKTQGITRVLNVRFFLIQSSLYLIIVFIKRSYVGFFLALYNLSCHCRDFGSRFFVDTM